MKRILLLAAGLLVACWSNAQLINVGFEVVHEHGPEAVADAAINGGVAVSYENYVTYKLYAYVENPSDQVVSVTGNIDDILAMSFTVDGQQFFQHPANTGILGPLSQGLLDAGGGSTFAMYQYDSFFTIGYSTEADVPDGENWSAATELVSGSDTWKDDFAAGNEVLINSFFGGGFFILPTNNAGIAVTDGEGNHKVTLGQFTFDTSLDNCLEFIGSVEVFPLGESGDGPTHGLVASTCAGGEIIPGCMDETALNYNPEANLEDGSCIYVCDLEVEETDIVITDALCFGEMTGSMVVQTDMVTGNQGGVTYSLNNVDFTANPNFSGLAGGDYTLYAVDGQECTTELAFTIGTGTQITVALEAGTMSQPSCNGLSDGSFCVTITGGIAPYTTALSQAGLEDGTSELCFTDLPGGTYTVWVQDANGCVKSSTAIFMGQPNPINVQTNVENNATCSYSEDGCIIALGTGGTPVYTYEIDGIVAPQTDNSLCGLAPGTYTVSVTGSNGCTANSNLVTISAPEAIEAIAGDITDVTCFDSTDGEICISASGGNGTYTFSSDNMNYSSIACFSDLAPDVYTVWAQSGQCQNSIVIEVEAPDQISYEFSQTNVDEDCDGELEVFNIGGGTGNITVTWEDADGNEFTTETISDLCIGDIYSVTLEDDNGCEVTEGPFNIVTGLYELANNISVNMYPNPTNGALNLNIEGLSGQKVSAVVLNALGEQVSAQDFGTLNGLWNNVLNLEGEADGIYFINLTVGEESITQRVIKQ